MRQPIQKTFVFDIEEDGTVKEVRITAESKYAAKAKLKRQIDESSIFTLRETV